MTAEATPLVLLVLLAFFFIVALAFFVWAALTLGDAGKRTELQRADAARRRAARQPQRERKPWERDPLVPTVPSTESARVTARDAAQGTLWERRPDNPQNHGAQPNSDAFERFLESEKRRE